MFKHILFCFKTFCMLQKLCKISFGRSWCIVVARISILTCIVLAAGCSNGFWNSDNSGNMFLNFGMSICLPFGNENMFKMRMIIKVICLLHTIPAIHSVIFPLFIHVCLTDKLGILILLMSAIVVSTFQTCVYNLRPTSKS